jgi:hypothetical protein
VAVLLLFAFAAIEAFVVDSLVGALGVRDRFVSAFLGALLGLLVRPLKRWMDTARSAALASTAWRAS